MDTWAVRAATGVNCAALCGQVSPFLPGMYLGQVELCVELFEGLPTGAVCWLTGHTPCGNV
jgi:hypothetical protein